MTSTSGTSPSARRVDVLFIGRANVDLSVRVPHLPILGRTVFGSAIELSPGGKSYNQAVAVAHLGGSAALVANAGDDPWGQLLRHSLAQEGVDVSQFHLIAGATTGAAVVHVTPDGESYVTLALSEQTELAPSTVHKGFSAVHSSVVVAQLDIEPAAVAAALDPTQSATLMGNLVPKPDLPRELLAALNLLVVNVQEASAILNTNRTDPLQAAQQLQRLGPDAAVVTAGPQGAAYHSNDASGVVEAPAVTAVDTTGAGDAFLGGLALSLARGSALPDAVASAVRVGSIAVQHPGPHLPKGATQP